MLHVKFHHQLNLIGSQTIFSFSTFQIPCDPKKVILFGQAKNAHQEGFAKVKYFWIISELTLILIYRFPFLVIILPRYEYFKSDNGRTLEWICTYSLVKLGIIGFLITGFGLHFNHCHFYTCLTNEKQKLRQILYSIFQDSTDHGERKNFTMSRLRSQDEPVLCSDILTWHLSSTS